MKFLFPILFLIACHPTHASWVDKAEMSNPYKTYWTTQGDCERSSKVGCVELPPDYNPDFYKSSFSAKKSVKACTDEADCKKKLSDACPKGEFRVIGSKFKETYCTKFLRVYTTKKLKQDYETKKRQEEQAQIQAQKTRQTNRLVCLAALKEDSDLTAAAIKTCFRGLL